jgi:HKD family nuclease
MRELLFLEDLFSEVLLKPAINEGANHLYIVSGYASSAMVLHHIEELKKNKSEINIYLIIGMSYKDGLSKTNHRGFQDLAKNLSNHFECSYLVSNPPVHSKVYSWVYDETPINAFIGSANYSQQAFIGRSQREIMTNCSPLQAYDYYQSLVDDTVYCHHEEAEEVITLYNDNRAVKSTKKSINKETEIDDSISGLEHINVSFINKYGKISTQSSLNWGHRSNREPNQAYIPLKAEICKTSFFPPRTHHFTVNTDDGKILICTRAQDNGKAIETPHNNSLLGEYFRYRLGVANGALVTMAHFEKYGRFDIDFYKIDEENYFMDFSVEK